MIFEGEWRCCKGHHLLHRRLHRTTPAYQYLPQTGLFPFVDMHIKVCFGQALEFYLQVCLLSHCGDGLSLSDYQRLKTQFVQAYGFQHLVTWNNLLKVGSLLFDTSK